MPAEPTDTGRGQGSSIDLAQEFEERVSARPIKYLLIAGGVGAVLGLFFRRN